MIKETKKIIIKVERKRERERGRKRIKTVVDLNYTAIKVPPTKARMGDPRKERIFRGFFLFSSLRFFLVR